MQLDKDTEEALKGFIRELIEERDELSEFVPNRYLLSDGSGDYFYDNLPEETKRACNKVQFEKIIQYINS